jgi:primosomal protein N''
MNKELIITSEISKDIVMKLMEGVPLTTICQAKGLPSLSRVYKEIQKNKDFAQEIMNARRVGCQTYLDRMIEELNTMDNRNVMVVRERLQHYRWLASKLLAVYGDRKEVAVDQKIEIKWSDADDMKVVQDLGSTDTTNKVSHTT